MNSNSVNGTNDSRPGGQLIPVTKVLPAQLNPYGTLAGYGVSPADESGLFGLGLLDYWRIAVKRKWLILGIVAAFMLLSAVRILMQTPLYTATVRLQIDRNVAKILDTGNVSPVVDNWDVEFMRTQYQILESRTMAERVASTLDLGNDPDFLAPRSFSLIGAIMGLLRPTSPPAQKPVDAGALKAAAIGVILGSRTVSPVTGSRLVDISYSDPNPARAENIANAFADAFLASTLDTRFQANASAKTFLEDKIQQLKLRLEESEKKLLDFAQRQQIMDADVNEKTSIAESNLAAANATLGNLATERTRNEQQWRQMENTDATNLPQILSNKVVDELRAQRKALTIEYQEKLETFKSDYPVMVQINNKIKEIDQQLAAEVQTIKASLKAAYEASLAQENETKARIGTLRQEVLDLQGRSIKYNILKREVDTNRELYASLLQRYKEVDVASGAVANNIFVVDRAELPGGPSSLGLLGALRYALLLGLGVASALAYLLERLDDKVRTPEQAESVCGLSLLGVIPKTKNIEDELADPRSGLAEAYRSLCTALQFTTDQGLPRTLTITSAGPSEGKSLTSIAIAQHFAKIGRKVLLVDGDLRNPSLHQRLQRDNSAGLSNYLIGASTPPEVMHKTGVPNLAFIPSGPLPPNAADLLAGTRIHSLLSIGLEVFDLIVIDGPPVMGLADAQLLSSASAATVFVVGAGQLRTALLRGALARLQLSRASVVGVVLTKYDAKAAGYSYGYGDNYGYGYGYGAHRAPTGLSIRHAEKTQPQLTDVHGGA